jgi:hypothetical protein
MGCVQSYLGKRSSAYRVHEPPDGEQEARQSKLPQPPEKQQQQQQKQKPAPPARPKLDPKDFMFCNLSGESRVKLPGWARWAWLRAAPAHARGTHGWR